MNQWEKICQLHRILKTSRYPVPLSRIIDELDCSAATFYRVNNIYQMRFTAPVVYDKKYRGYKLDDSKKQTFELPGLWFSQDELEAMACCERLLAELGPGLFSGIVAPFHKRIGDLLKAQKIPRKRWLNRIKILSIGFRVVDSAIFEVLAQAIFREKQARIDYYSPYKNEYTKRIISPQILLRYRDNWYVDAFCHMRSQLRTFAVNRIESAELLDLKSVVVPKEQLNAHFSDAYGIFSGVSENIAEIEFTGVAVRIVPAEYWHPRQSGTYTDKGYILRIPYRESAELVTDILRWGKNAVVLSPESLKQKVKNMLIDTLEQYQEE